VFAADFLMQRCVRFPTKREKTMLNQQRMQIAKKALTDQNE